MYTCSYIFGIMSSNVNSSLLLYDRALTMN